MTPTAGLLAAARRGHDRPGIARIPARAGAAGLASPGSVRS